MPDFGKAALSQLGSKADKTYVDTQITAVNASPKGVYALLTDLQTAFPTGNNNIYLVTADGKWYYWNGSAWTAGGVYQSTGLAAGSVTSASLHDEILSRLPYLQATDSANNATNVGAYLALSSLDMPEASGTFVLHVQKARTVSGNAQYWLVQTATKESPNSKQYKRFGYYSGSAFTWQSWTECLDTNSTIDANKISNNAIPRTKLNDDFMMNYSYIPASGDINTALTQGNYIVLGGAANSPIANLTYTLKVDVFKTSAASSYWITQIATTADNAARSFIRKLFQGQTFSSWVELTTRENWGYEGKSIVMFGDSITENGDYPARVAGYLGATVTSLGFGGCSMANFNPLSGNGLYYDKMCMHHLAEYISSGVYTELTQAAADLYTATADDNRPQVSRLAALDWTKVDIATIFFGTNDFGLNIPIGTDTDSDGTTFKGAINKIINLITTAHPNVKLFFITPTWRARFASGDGKESDTNPNTIGKYLIEYVDALKTVANNNHIPVLDMYRESGINKYNNTYLLADGLHPVTGIGYEHVARKITTAIKSRF